MRYEHILEIHQVMAEQYWRYPQKNLRQPWEVISTEGKRSVTHMYSTYRDACFATTDDPTISQVIKGYDPDAGQWNERITRLFEQKQPEVLVEILDLRIAAQYHGG